MATNSLENILNNALSYSNENAFRQDVYYLAQKVFSLSYSDLLINQQKVFDDEVFTQYLNRYLSGEPLYYILKKAPFMGYDFVVDKNVLIPRNETEELTILLVDEIKENNIKQAKIIDVGCGSGCISISLDLLISDSIVTGVDISSQALKVSEENSQRLNSKVNFYLSNCLDEVIKRKEQFNYLISNPPYIDRNSFVEKSVLDYEPHLALFADNKGLAIIEKILSDIDKVLLPKGKAYFEISPEQVDDLSKIIKNKLPRYQFSFKKDINNFTRFLLLEKE